MNTKSGFVGILLLVIASVLAVGEVFYFLKHKETPPPVAVEEKTDDSSSQLALANFVSNAIAQNTVTTKETPASSEEAKPVDKKAKDSLAVNDSSTLPPPPAKTTPPPAPTPAPKEPEVTVPTLLIRGGEQPKPTLLLAGAARVPFTVLELTAKGGDIDIYHLDIERQGLGSDRIFTEVGVIDIDYERALRSNHQYSTNETFTIKNGETREITIFGNIAYSDTLPDYDGQSPTLALVRVETNAQVVDSQPVVETAHTVNSNLTIGSVQMVNSGFDPGVGRNLYINSTNVTFSAVRATAGTQEPMLLQWFAFTQNGSASQDDLANVQICVDNKGAVSCYDTDHEDGKYYFADFGNAVKIEKGESVDVYIKGDVGTTGVTRTIDFDITTSYDILAYGLTYKNYTYSYGGDLDGAQPEGSFSTSEYPFYNGYKHTIQGGSFNSVGK